MEVNLESPVLEPDATRLDDSLAVKQVATPCRVARWRIIVWAAAAVFFGICTGVSWLRWWNFQYRTFDLAYYVQGVWQLIHWRFAVSIENVPLLGNHVEPIVFLFAPLFAVVRHPMLFVTVQNAALASMAVIGYRMARDFVSDRAAALLSVALLLTPATAYVALHEFHPEALTAPLLLAMVYSRSNRRLLLHWGCFVGILACKENMALLLGAYCCVFLVLERKHRVGELIRWYGAPLIVSAVWFVLCVEVITPVLNSGNIDYLSLYARLGKSAGEILRNVIAQPQLAGNALFHSIRHGNLVWGLLIPFVCLPLLRPRWLVIAAPVLLQHLLSWRSSEWQIYFHYAAPLLPLFWIATLEAIGWLNARSEGAARTGRDPAGGGRPGVAGACPELAEVAPRSSVTESSRSAVAVGAVALACLTAQIWIGPARTIGSELASQSSFRADRQRKAEFIDKIPAHASVVAPLPYLSHLAAREKLYSLHYILKGLKTLSREQYEPPPPTDFVLVDYDDTATFDPSAGYYHPQMRTADGRVIPSSDRLLHDFLSTANWNVSSQNALALFQKTVRSRHDELGDRNSEQGSPSVVDLGGNELRSIRFDRSGASIAGFTQLNFELRWRVSGSRQAFPWMRIRLTGPAQETPHTITKGLCAIEIVEGDAYERWIADLSPIPAGEYFASAMFVDAAQLEWQRSHGNGNPRMGAARFGDEVYLGRISIGR